MPLITKRGTIFGVALLCVLFSFSSLWRTQNLTFSTTQQVFIPSSKPVIATTAIVSTPTVETSAGASEAPSSTSTPSLDSRALLSSTPSSLSYIPSPSPTLLQHLPSTINPTTASPTSTPSSSISPSSLLSSHSTSTIFPAPSNSPFSTPPSRTPSISPTSSPSNFAIYIPSSLHGNRTSKSSTNLFDFETTINTPIEIHVTTLFNTSHNFWINTSEPSAGRLHIPEKQESEKNFAITFVPPQWFVGTSEFKWMAKDSQNAEYHGRVKIRIRTGVVLNHAILETPLHYQFAETTAIATRGIQSIFYWWRDHPGVIPKQDTWLTRRYKTCAVVGNGGSLRGSKRGAEIDSHDVVVRLNVSPFLNYTEDVGSKLNISVSNAGTSSDCWTRKPHQLPENATFEILAIATFQRNWDNYESCVKKNPHLTYTPMSYLFVDLVDSILNEYHSKMFNGIGKRYRSTGMLAVTAMSMICDHVSVYGFERGPNMENNYYDSKYDREWSGHSYQAEKAYYKELAQGSGLFEKYLNLYDVYKSFDYIVD